MEQAKQKMLKARIRRRKQEQADPSDYGGPGEFTEATCGLPQDSLAQGRKLLRKLRLDARALSDSDCMTLLRLLDLNPGSYQVEVSKARMAISAAAPLTWGHFTHLWNDAIEADKGTLHMLETAFPFFDQDGSGTITRQEMKEQFAELGGLLSDDEIDQFHEILDVDGNGVIDYNEFIAALQTGIAAPRLPEDPADAAASPGSSRASRASDQCDGAGQRCPSMDLQDALSPAVCDVALVDLDGSAGTQADGDEAVFVRTAVVT